MAILHKLNAIAITKRVRVLAMLLAVIVVLSGFTWQAQPGNILQVTMEDVGQGDALLITAPNGARVLIDTGKSNHILELLGRQLHNTRTLDALILTHPDQDHIGQAPEILEQYDVRYVIRTGVECSTNICGEIDTRLQSASPQTDVVYAEAGQVIHLDPEHSITLSILHPFTSQNGATVRDKNDTSIVALLRYNESEVLFTGDASTNIEQQLVQSYGDIHADVLKIGHHGSKTSTDTQFLEAVDPDVALVSVGAENSYGHPNETVLERITASGAALYRTDTMGTVNLCTDGSGDWENCSAW